jgi:hypothetical protein
VPRGSFVLVLLQYCLGRVPRACIQLILVGAVLTLLALYQSLETLTGFIPQKRMHVNGSAARIPLVAAWVRPCRPCWMVCDMMCCALRERDSLAIVRLVLFVTGVADCMHSGFASGPVWVGCTSSQPAAATHRCWHQTVLHGCRWLSFERCVSCQAVLSPSSCSAYYVVPVALLLVWERCVVATGTLCCLPTVLEVARDLAPRFGSALS